MNQNINHNKQRLSEDINGQFQQLYLLLEERKQQLQLTLNDICSTKQSELTLQQSELESLLSSFNSSCQVTSKAISSNNSVHFLDIQQQLDNRLKELNSTQWMRKPKHDDVVLYEMDIAKLKDDVSHFGRIQNSTPVHLEDSIKLVLRAKGLELMDPQGKAGTTTTNLISQTAILPFANTDCLSTHLPDRPSIMLSHLRTNPKTKPVRIAETELINRTVDLIWKPITVPVHSLCGGDIENGAILVQCWGYDDGKSEVIGSFTVSILLLISISISISSI